MVREYSQAVVLGVTKGEREGMSEKLSPNQNSLLGFVSGAVEVSALQSMNYWKNASQQGLPFTLNPRVLYRGYPSNLSNMGLGTMFQFAVCGRVQQIFLGESVRQLTVGEELASGFISGISSGIIVGPLELMMIQQQRKGGSILMRARDIGLKRVYRGIVPAAAREGIWSLGYLSFPPLIRRYLLEHYPARFQGNPDLARLFASVAGAFVSAIISHPFDTVKTCMQGDIERAKFTGSLNTVRTILQKRDVSALYRGFG